MLIFDIKESV